MSGSASGLVENIAAGGRPARGRPPRAAVEAAVGDAIDALARSGRTGKVADTLTQLDAIANSPSADALVTQPCTTEGRIFAIDQRPK